MISIICENEKSCSHLIYIIKMFVGTKLSQNSKPRNNYYLEDNKYIIYITSFPGNCFERLYRPR